MVGPVALFVVGVVVDGAAVVKVDVDVELVVARELDVVGATEVEVLEEVVVEEVELLVDGVVVDDASGGLPWP